MGFSLPFSSPLFSFSLRFAFRGCRQLIDLEVPWRTIWGGEGLIGIGKFFTDGRIAPRSGLASKNFIDTGAGVIDADYRGQVKVLLFNHGEKDFEGRCL